MCIPFREFQCALWANFDTSIRIATFSSPYLVQMLGIHCIDQTQAVVDLSL